MKTIVFTGCLALFSFLNNTKSASIVYRNGFFFLSVFDVAWMMFYDFTSQHIAVDVGVDFGSRNRLMPQHALDSPQIGASFK